MLCRKVMLTFGGLLSAGIMYAQVEIPKALQVSADKIVAVVGDQIILASYVSSSVEDLKRQNLPVPPNAACLVTEQAIISKLLMLQALKDSLPVTEEDIERELNNRLEYFFKRTDADIDDKTRRKIADDAREQLREMMLAGAMKEKVLGNVKITPAEVTSFFNQIPQANLPLVEPEVEVGQIILYPVSSKELEQYAVSELANYKNQVERKSISFCQLTKTSGDEGACTDHEINRNSTHWDPAFLSAAFRLKNGEISLPVKCKMGFYLIQMEERRGDDATVRYIYRPHILSDPEINQAKAVLNTLRTDIRDGKIGFNEAALNYSDDKTAGYPGPFFLNSEGSTHLTIDQLDKEVAGTVEKMSAGEISIPMLFIDDTNRKGVRIIYLKSRSALHRMNLRDDYGKISQLALEEKKTKTFDKWMATKIPSYYIMVDKEASSSCPEVQKYAATATQKF